MGKSYIDAKVPDKQERLEREEVNVIVFVNVMFSLLPFDEIKKRIAKDNLQEEIHLALADVVIEHPCYHANLSLAHNPDKLYAYECDVQCSDLYFDENGECIDTLGAYSKIIHAYNQVDDYLSELAFPPGTKVQVCINVIGFEVISDIVWGFSFMADASCPNNVDDDLLNDLIMDEYEPLALDYINKGWTFNVAFVDLLELAFALELTKPSEMNTANAKKDSLQPVSNTNKTIPSKYVENNVTTEDVNSADESGSKPTSFQDENPSPIMLKGGISQTRINLSSFLSFNHLLDCLYPPMAIIRFIDRLTGVDKLEATFWNEIAQAYQAFINQDKDEGWKHLKKAGGTSLDIVHNRLSLISFYPGASAISGLIDGLLYTTQSCYFAYNLNSVEAKRLQGKAFVSYSSMIPFYKIFRYTKPAIKSAKVLNAQGRILQNAAKRTKNAADEFAKTTTAKNAIKNKVKELRKKNWEKTESIKKTNNNNMNDNNNTNNNMNDNNKENEEIDVSKLDPNSDEYWLALRKKIGLN